MYEYDEEEVFRNIPRFEGYQVTNRGRVYSLKRDRFLKLTRTNGKNSVSLYRKGRTPETRLVDRLVAEAFLTNPVGTRYIKLRHLDGDALNDDVDNLEWSNYPRMDL